MTDNAWYVLYGMIHMVALVLAGYHSTFGAWGNHGYTCDHYDTGAIGNSTGSTGSYDYETWYCKLGYRLTHEI